MKTKMLEYLATIGITDQFLKRAIAVYMFYQKVVRQDFLDIFVDDYIDAEGARHYESLWIFNRNYVMEAKQFLTQDAFDIAPLKRSVKYWRIVKTNYDFNKANEKSRMNLDVTLWAGLQCGFKASRENCDSLRNVFLKHIQRNIIVNASPVTH